jgi:hypothetical protein
MSDDEKNKKAQLKSQKKPKKIAEHRTYANCLLKAHASKAQQKGSMRRCNR